jgi:hypothetical protein
MASCYRERNHFVDLPSYCGSGRPAQVVVKMMQNDGEAENVDQFWSRVYDEV